MSLSSFCVDYLLLGMEPTHKGGFFSSVGFPLPQVYGELPTVLAIVQIVQKFIWDTFGWDAAHSWYWKLHLRCPLGLCLPHYFVISFRMSSNILYIIGIFYCTMFPYDAPQMALVLVISPCIPYLAPFLPRLIHFSYLYSTEFFSSLTQFQLTEFWIR